ncbi:uncharacterized protein LOC124657897 isoform X3 [Lolium rigidum]|uniref:uncharacterized protein LOC124657897 isoform X3 n=1 Tax=Lolium rigidum TaxID=89674 RepID=UPI001F5CD17B|nr:uncharacterized protein LOC124657897 isoform X3 [Lolium rigidum]
MDLLPQASEAQADGSAVAGRGCVQPSPSPSRSEKVKDMHLMEKVAGLLAESNGRKKNMGACQDGREDVEDSSELGVKVAKGGGEVGAPEQRPRAGATYRSRK